MSPNPAPPAAHPTFTNAHAQMCTVITAITDAWGADGEAIIRHVYRDLGHHTGAEMIATGVVPAGADLETYGRVSEQIMDTCGLEGWTRVATDAVEHRTIVPGCAAYVPLFEYLQAPANICSLPFEWDNGCLDVINDDLEVWPRSCVYRGAGECHYVISLRDQDRSQPAQAPTAALPAGTARPAAAVAVQAEPTWTNPTAGLLALIGAAVAAYGDEAYAVLRPALHALGAKAGADEVASPAADAAQIAELIVRRYRAAGFTEATAVAEADGRWRVDLGHNPYGPVLARFAAHRAAATLFAEYDDGWATAAPRVDLVTAADGWAAAGQHTFTISARS
ncbi:hypothetical protein AB0M46_24210 [Dactylosporangium sp. NPDC051485]|uniref:hypothetical protein n=1 Tax=Dactylosporangium sp. NPDC051485 TaxID=3154846 RepID=UPI0034461CFB